MPRGRKPDGEHALSNAERQARYRTRRLAQSSPTKTRLRHPTDRRSRPQRWRDAVSETPSASCWHYRPSMPTGSRHCLAACATAPSPKRSKPLPISTSRTSPASSRPAATDVTKLQWVGDASTIIASCAYENGLTPRTPYKQLPTPARGRPWAGERLLRHLTGRYGRSTQALRRPVEPGLAAHLKTSGVIIHPGSVNPALPSSTCNLGLNHAYHGLFEG